MDIHRCRFVPYQPSAINAVAFSHLKTRSAKQTSIARLAIGRANGNIEIWNPSKGTWHQESVFRGGKDRSIDGLVWVTEPDQDLGDGKVLVGKLRLFSIGYTSTITEWDLEKGKPKRHASGQHGDIWCLAAQPSTTTDLNAPASLSNSTSSNKLIAGTIDGELVIYSLEDDDLRFQRVLVKSPTKKAQMVSITFQSRKVVLVGCSDSTIRAYDTSQGHMLRRMTLGSDLAGGSKDIIVWSVKCLPNGNIVSGDSTGQVCVWDGKTYTQLQRIQSHKQDVLSLTTSADGTSIMSGGMDRRTILYKQNPSAGKRWSKVWGRRYHDHDVKSMASFEHGGMSVVVSGGPDANLIVVPLKQMGKENHRLLSNLPQEPPLTSASSARFLLSWWDREVHIWSLRKPATELFNNSGEDIDLNENRKLLKTVLIKGDSNISSATIDADGKLLIVSTATDVKAFRLEHNNPVRPSDLVVSAIQLPTRLTSHGATHVKLSPNGKNICFVQEGSRILSGTIATSSSDSDTSALSVELQKLTRLRRHIPRYILNGGLGKYDRSIACVAFSADSKMLAVADLAGYVDTWIQQDQLGALRQDSGEDGADDASSSSDSDSSSLDEDVASNGSRWIRNPQAKLLPKLPSAPVILSFSDDVPGPRGSMNGEDAENQNADYTLAAVTASWNVIAFNPLQGSLTPWSRRHPRHALPAPVQDLLDLAKGAIWQGSRMWIYGVSFLVMLDMDQNIDKAQADTDSPCGAGQESQVAQGLKRKRKGYASGAGGKMGHESLAPHQLYKHTTNGQEEEIDADGVDSRSIDGQSDSDEDMAEPDGELAQLRNNATTSGANGDRNAVVTGTERKTWWITHKYRPVLGVVPLNAAGQSLEVALVERPTWDIDMPDRYFVGDEWEK